MNVDVIGVPIDLGADRRGVDMGPSAIRYAGLKKALIKMHITYRDLGNLDVPVPESDPDITNEKMKHLAQINKVNEMLSKKVSQVLDEGHFPLILGGDHSIAVGSLLGAQKVLKNIGVIWVDAHGDFNTGETTLSGNLHGMSLAASTGVGAREMSGFIQIGTEYIHPSKVVLIGARDIDHEEAELIKKSGINVFTMTDIDHYGIRGAAKRALEIATKGTEGFHLSFDLDSISPNEAPGVGTPVKGGLTYREAHFIAEMVADSGRMCSCDFVEVNPILDNKNQTGELAVSLICSALGKKIL